VYKGGQPYAPQVQKLKEAFPASSLVEGSLIEHGRLEAVLQLARNLPRYRSVVLSWMGDLRDSGLVIRWERRIGVKVLSPSDTLEYAGTKTRQKARQLVKATRIYGLVDRSRLTESQQQTFDHETTVAARVKQTMEEVRKEITLPAAKSIQTLPMPVQPQEPPAEKKPVQSDELPAEKGKKAASEKE
jgi:hypothetical protein